MTLRELERWLTLAIAYYHKDIHGNNQTETPSILWAEGIKRFGLPAVVTHATAFLIDFLPVIRRTLTRTGFVIDHIGYFADSLKPLIARRDKRSRFLIRRDPRDLSRIWVLEPDTQHYLEIPYRTLSNPAITLWEHRQVLARLRQLSRDRVDESALFRMVKQMRAISSDAQKATKKTRRNNERLQHLKNSAPKINQTPRDNALEPNPIESNPALPYAEIEEW